MSPSPLGSSLSKLRRKRKTPASLTPSDTISSFKLSTLPQPASASPITAFDLHLTSNLTLAGHTNGSIAVNNAESKSLLASSPTAHTGGVTAVSWNPHLTSTSSFITGGKDRAIRVWELNEAGQPVGKFAMKGVFSGDVVGVTVHVSGEYFVAAGGDGQWVFGEYGTGR